VPIGPKKARSTAISVEEEAIVVAFVDIPCWQTESLVVALIGCFTGAGLVE
jgi:hypothetical protein